MKITMFKNKTTAVENFREGEYEFVKCDWLKRLLLKFGIIRTLVGIKEVYHRVAFDEKKFASELLDRYYYTQSLGIRPKQVFMGPHEFEELIADKNVWSNGLMAIDITVPIWENKMLFDLPVKVVPYMTGVLFV